MAKRHSYKEIQRLFSKEKWQLLSKSYKNCKTKLVVLCPKKHKIHKTVSGFLDGDGCSICSGKKKYTINDVKMFFLKENYTLLSKRYMGGFKKLKFICPQGHQHTISLFSFLRGRRCEKCFGHIKHTLKIVIKMFKKRNWTVLSKKYINSTVPLNVVCDKGHNTKITLGNFSQGVGCKQCQIIATSGKNHYNWRNDLSKKDRVARRSLKENSDWIQEILKQDNYKCQICNKEKSGHLNAHHLESYHWCKELRFDLNNGVTVCDACHMKFHNKFGRRYNTSEQFYIFLRNNND
jgi:hypothetical protein